MPLATRYDERVSVSLLSNYQLQDIGLLLIHGRLPDNATSYNAENIFDVAPMGHVETEKGYGYGLVVGADDVTAIVQFGK